VKVKCQGNIDGFETSMNRQTGELICKKERQMQSSKELKPVSMVIRKLDSDGLEVTTHTHTCLTALFPGLPGWAGTRKVKPIWILLKQETVSSSGISWAYASLHLAPDRYPRQHLTAQFFYTPDALPAAQPTASTATALKALWR